MEDRNPVEQKGVFKQDRDPSYKKKLELSYLQCLKELSEPCENWHDKVMETKFTMDPNTGQPKTTHIFILENSDDIKFPEDKIKHSYVFKRSHFYQSFNKQRSRLKRDLITCWKARGYYIRLYKDETMNKWCLSLSWRN